MQKDCQNCKVASGISSSRSKTNACLHGPSLDLSFIRNDRIPPSCAHWYRCTYTLYTYYAIYVYRVHITFINHESITNLTSPASKHPPISLRNFDPFTFEKWESQESQRSLYVIWCRPVLFPFLHLKFFYSFLQAKTTLFPFRTNATASTNPRFFDTLYIHFLSFMYSIGLLSLDLDWPAFAQQGASPLCIPTVCMYTLCMILNHSGDIG